MLCSMTRSPMLKQIDFAFLVIGTLVRLAVIGAFEMPLASLRYAGDGRRGICYENASAF